MICFEITRFGVSFEVHTYTSHNVLGGVLVQARHHVAFESRKLDETEQQYSSHEKEMIVVIYFLEHWKHYLLGTTLVVVTDNVANTYFKS